MYIYNLVYLESKFLVNASRMRQNVFVFPQINKRLAKILQLIKDSNQKEMD